MDEALALHQRAADGQTHPFEGRQGSVAYALAQAHARLGACDDVRRVLAALHAHGQALPRKLPDPRKGTRCQRPE
ncbi:MAG: hypothetical protein ABWX87_10060 [Pseudoxanthomonas sp.]